MNVFNFLPKCSHKLMTPLKSCHDFFKVFLQKNYRQFNGVATSGAIINV